jgi:hypothetical protein
MRTLKVTIASVKKPEQKETASDQAILKLNEFLGKLCDHDPSFDTAYDYGNLKMTYKGKVYEIKPTSQKFPTDN